MRNLKKTLAEIDPKIGAYIGRLSIPPTSGTAANIEHPIAFTKV